jgi:UDP-N-acetylglucosamine--N-acetylmuramyl-(pentapeptide) pyrophosphoryl-undecaprenol N-acetylglucosamine transferase
MLEKLVDRVLTGFPNTGKAYMNNDKVLLTGTPVRGEFRSLSKEEARASLGIAQNEKLVVSLWGSLGANHMNGVIKSVIERLLRERSFRLVHATGERGFSQFIADVGGSAERLMDAGIDVRDYIHDMPRVMAAADLVLCRAGASTLSELAALHKPAVLIPSPNVTNNHQEKNARVLERAGAARVLLEGGFDADSLFDLVSSLLKDSGELFAMSENMSQMAVSDSVERITDILLGLAERKNRGAL